MQTASKHSGAYGRLHPDKACPTLLTRFDTPLQSDMLLILMKIEL